MPEFPFTFEIFSSDIFSSCNLVNKNSEKTSSPIALMNLPFIDSFTTATELTTGRDRLVKGNFGIRLRGYIVPDTIQKEMNSISKYNSKSKIIISMETTSNSDIFKPGVTKTKDGRTRRQVEYNGEIANISDQARGTELKQNNG